MARSLTDMTPEERQACVGMWGVTPMLSHCVGMFVISLIGGDE